MRTLRVLPTQANNVCCYEALPAARLRPHPDRLLLRCQPQQNGSPGEWENEAFNEPITPPRPPHYVVRKGRKLRREGCTRRIWTFTHARCNRLHTSPVFPLRPWLLRSITYNTTKGTRDAKMENTWQCKDVRTLIRAPWILVRNDSADA